MSLRLEVLKCFKALHKARKLIFEGDQRALSYIREKINEEFIKHKNETDVTKIQELVKLGHEVEHELKSTVVQAKEVDDGVYRLRILPETEKLDNVEYNDCINSHTKCNNANSKNPCGKNT